MSDNVVLGFVSVLAAAGTMLWSYLAGADANWDLRNYHYFLGFSFWHSNLAQSFYPAQIQTWLNPVLDGMTTGFMENMSAFSFSMILAVVQSLNAPLLFIIASQAADVSLPTSSPGERIIVALIATLIGMTSAMTLSEVGTTLGDDTLSLLSLGALALLGHLALKPEVPTRAAVVPITLAGFCVGAACGLKLTNLLFLPGFLLGFVFMQGVPRPKLKKVAIFLVASLLGLAVTNGYYMWTYWYEMGNPFFPFWNGVFKSPWYDAVNFFDGRFNPKTLTSAATFLYASALGGRAGSELPFSDPRQLIAVVSTLCLAYRRPRGWALGLFLFFIVGLVFWLKTFAIQRYAVTLDMLTGVMMLILVAPCVPPLTRPWILGIIALVCVFTTEIPDWSHMEWQRDQAKGNWFGVEVPLVVMHDHELFVMLGDDPLSFVIPFFPATSQFVRLQGNFNPSPATLMATNRDELIMGHVGASYLLSANYPTPLQVQILAGYGLTASNDCLPIVTRVQPLIICSLVRRAGDQKR